MRRFLDGVARFWRDRVRGPVLRTYDEAREELGGVPWRAFGTTERWFAAAAPPPLPADAGAGSPAVPPPIPLDTGDIRLLPPSLMERARTGLERLGSRGRLIAAASTACVLAIVVLLIASPSSSVAATVEPLPPPVAQALAPLALPSHPLAHHAAPAAADPPPAAAAPSLKRAAQPIRSAKRRPQRR